MVAAVKWLALIGVISVAGIGVIAFFLHRMFDIAPRTEKAVLANRDNELRWSDAHVVEREAPESADKSGWTSVPTAPATQSYLVNENGILKPGDAVFDDEVSRQYQVLKTPKKTLAFQREKLFDVVDDRVGDEITAWRDTRITFVDAAMPLDEDHLLVAGRTHDVGISLFQVDLTAFTTQKIADDVFYPFIRAPQVWDFDDLVVAVAYVGDYTYAMGGDASRPKHSLIRVYSEQFPNGQDLAALSFDSGTVIDVLRTDEHELVLVADPNRPNSANQAPRALRYWTLRWA